MNTDTVEKTIFSLQSNYLQWKNSSFNDRSNLLKELANILLNHHHQKALALLMAKEMGKPYHEGIAEIIKCAFVCNYYAENGEKFLADEQVINEVDRHAFVTFQPLGIIFAIMPWNFPLWQVFRFAAPAIMAGNVVLLKHASNVTATALEIERLFNLASNGILLILKSIVFNGSDTNTNTLENIISNPLISAVTFTGSTPVGRIIGQLSGKYLKKSILELGGSDPYIIFADADIAHAAKICVKSRLINCGQSCIAAKRFIVHRSIISKFEELVVEEIKKVVLVDPSSTEELKNNLIPLGPLARKDIRDELHQQVLTSVKMGAKLIMGGKIPTTNNDPYYYYYPPTILTDVKKGMPSFDQELFGPVMAIIYYSDDDEAIQIANDTSFGLGAAIFSKDLQKASRVASKLIESGNVFINDFVKSDPRLPFGGIKESGYGRELSYFGIREFVNIKTISVSI
ncbi:MAG: NAD-dependent succinate-semialdehyde dehydrogenase [Oligoflexia bacterium]|nr:NAD-dependent succinate-semialdehyde dehydrogenase [Oligoflexia bacterium]